MVNPQHILLGRAGQESEEVAVVAELASLRLGGLVEKIKLRRAGEDWVAPTDEHLVGIAGGNNDLVEGVRLDRREGQRPARGSLGHRCRSLDLWSGTAARGEHHRGRHRALKQCAAAYYTPYQGRERLVVAPVRWRRE